ncbi:acyltransferase [Aurantiacibacter rhizosphaerae]|uniref:Acyltransferase n=1 Tax=Aurantiacibacter rhizosphaerae TaxID=2691582 RepID=A0A844XG52_9SPHN|nr:acyltransferase [Aurantiacibacter rhizosphaerae]MWV29457.1 acyltransferase [Aurantiacibacter rhizosphaerae]
MAYLGCEELEAMGFAALGANVKVSDKASIYEPEKITIGDFSRIDDFCVISGRVTLGRNVHIAPFCLVAGGEPGVVMEDFAGLAYGVQVFSQSDDYSGRSLTNPTVPAAYKHETKRAVRIGRHTIIGARAIVMPGVSMAEGTAVGAGALVSKSTQEWSIYAGSPARRVKKRSSDLLGLEQQYLANEGCL